MPKILPKMLDVPMGFLSYFVGCFIVYSMDTEDTVLRWFQTGFSGDGTLVLSWKGFRDGVDVS